MRAALLVIDLQKAYYMGHAVPLMDSASQIINKAIPLFRRNDLPIIWIQHMDKDDGAIPGVEGFEFIDSLKPGNDDMRIEKAYNNSFNKTNLSELMIENKIDTIVISGYCAEYCIIATYWGAKNIDIKPLLLKKGIAGNSEKSIKAVEEICSVIDYEKLEKRLNGVTRK